MSPSRDHATADRAATRKVLVVQNEPTLRLGFSYALSSPSTVVHSAANGHETLEMVESTPFDIIILDLRMPGMDGIHVIEKIRSSGDRIPIVLCTALHHPNASMRAIALGVVDFLIKPTHPEDVRRIVDFVIQPPPSRLSLALAAVRRGDPEIAIRSLEDIPWPDIKERSWLKALTLIRDSCSSPNTARFEEEVRSCFPLLAFNPPTVS